MKMMMILFNNPRRTKMLIFSSTEKHSYIVSLENFSTLKAFHDAGVDVSSFADFMTDINYDMDSAYTILYDGLEVLFDNFKEYSPYELEDDDDYSKDIKKYLSENNINTESERYFFCSNQQLNEICRNEKYYQVLKKSFDEENGFKSSITEGDLYLLSDGQIVFTIEFIISGSSIATVSIKILNKIKELYEQMVGETDEACN